MQVQKNHYQSKARQSPQRCAPYAVSSQTSQASQAKFHINSYESQYLEDDAIEKNSVAESGLRGSGQYEESSY